MSHRHSIRGTTLLRIAVAVVIVLGLGALVIWGFSAGRKQAALEAERESPVKVPLRVSTENGASVITLDRAAQQQSGVETTILQRAPYQQQIRAYGTVLDLQQFTDLSNNYVNAKAQLQAVQAKLAASQGAFERARRLYEDQQNMSAAQLQAAEATYRADRAALASAQSQLRTLAATAEQNWGPVFGQALVAELPMVTRLIERQDFVVQVTLPPGVFIEKVPEIASAQLGNARRVRLKYVSAATKTDPKIQGLSFFYIAPAESGLLPGLNVLAFLPDGTPVAAGMVPQSAVVWVQGKAWVYLRTGPQTFTRREIATDLPTPDGGYVIKGLPSKTQLVTQGAQALLSEEFRAQFQVGQD